MARSVTTSMNSSSKSTEPAVNGSADGNGSENAAAAAAERDFFWTYTEEPHRTRRLAIIKAHPEVCLAASWQSQLDRTNMLLISQVTKLCGPEPLTKYVVAGVVALQLLLAHMLRDTPFWSWKFWAVAYVFGATCNQNLFLAIHEISHNLAFRSPTANRLFAIFANLPIAVPYSASFRVSVLLHFKSPL
jgi:sphingolipid delta-4 desaturase